MNISHSETVSKLVKSGFSIKNSMTNEQAHLIHMTMGISGEAGELLDAIKKHVMYGKELDRENIIEELGDLEFYMEGLRQGLGIKREDTIWHNINKLSVRYKDHNYSDEQAIARKDKVLDKSYPDDF